MKLIDNTNQLSNGSKFGFLFSIYNPFKNKITERSKQMSDIILLLLNSNIENI